MTNFLMQRCLGRWLWPTAKYLTHLGPTWPRKSEQHMALACESPTRALSRWHPVCSGAVEFQRRGAAIMIMADQSAAIQPTSSEQSGTRPLSRLAERLTEVTGGINVGHTERVVSSVAGGALALAGIRMRSLPGAVLAAVGGAMFVRGVTGHCPAYESLGVN